MLCIRVCTIFPHFSPPSSPPLALTYTNNHTNTEWSCKCGHFNFASKKSCNGCALPKHVVRVCVSLFCMLVYVCVWLSTRCVCLLLCLCVCTCLFVCVCHNLLKPLTLLTLLTLLPYAYTKLIRTTYTLTLPGVGGWAGQLIMQVL
jgi:hypothetical protein